MASVLPALGVPHAVPGSVAADGQNRSGSGAKAGRKKLTVARIGIARGKTWHR